jgi:hypothetical protein
MKFKKMSKKQIEHMSKVQKEIEENKKIQLTAMQEREIGSLKVQYITRLVNARFFLARCNMIADQLINKKIIESIDGCPKTEEYMYAEYAQTKKGAIDAFRDKHFAKKRLLEIGVKQEELDYIEKDYYNGKIIREDYEDVPKIGRKADFVKVSDGQAKKEHESYMG